MADKKEFNSDDGEVYVNGKKEKHIISDGVLKPLKEFDLSERICYEKNVSPNLAYSLFVEDVKEFIRRAREILENCISGGCDRELILSNFDKLAGEKLR